MSVRDLDEMGAFKNSEARLIERGEGDPIDKAVTEMGLADLRRAHQAYIRGEAALQLVTPLFDYADHNFDSPKKEGDS